MGKEGGGKMKERGRGEKQVIIILRFPQHLATVAQFLFTSLKLGNKRAMMGVHHFPPWPAAYYWTLGW